MENLRFKFRVWNDMQKCYSPDDHYIDEDGQLNTSGKYIIEQCTGLKDKNGQLIYEGDILKPNSNTITKEVVYEDGSYWAKDTIYFHDKCHIIQKLIDECGYEIVGNIHENEETDND